MPFVRVRQHEVGEWSQSDTIPLREGQELVPDVPPHDSPLRDVPWTAPADPAARRKTSPEKE